MLVLAIASVIVSVFGGGIIRVSGSIICSVIDSVIAIVSGVVSVSWLIIAIVIILIF